MKQLFRPFGEIGKKTRVIVIVFWSVFFIGMFELFHSPIIPPPSKIGGSFIQLVQTDEFFENLLSSTGLTLKAMFFSILITVLLVYSSTLPFFKPLAEFVSKCRYLTLTGLVYVFTILSSNMSDLKMTLLIFGITPFFVTSFFKVVEDTPDAEKQKGYVNKLGRWGTLLEIVVIGKLDILFEVMRQNFAITWMMITTVEGYAMADGGIGTMLIKNNRVMNMSSVFAMLLSILLLGLLFDYLLSKARYLLFPYLIIKKK